MRTRPGRVRGAGATSGTVLKGAEPPAGFVVAEADAAAPTAAVLPAGAPGALGGILALQEAELAAIQERQARRHGLAMLDALAALQAALLGPGRESALPALSRLLALLAAMPDAADPGLRQALRGTALRARLELARHAVAPPRPP